MGCLGVLSRKSTDRPSLKGGEMGRFETITSELLSWLGLAMAIAAAVVGMRTSNADSKVWLRLLTGSVVAMWPALILFFRQTHKHFDEIEPYITGKLELEQKKAALRRALQAGTFGGTKIDHRFWHRFGEMILNDSQLSRSVRPAEICAAVKESSVRVPEKIRYELMEALLRQMIEGKQPGKQPDPYFATATLKELVAGERNTFARRFLYELPKQYPKYICRIIAVDSLNALQAKVSQEGKNDIIDQLRNGVELRVVVMTDPETLPNFGVYGHIAVGELDEDGSNVVNFDPEYVRTKRDTILFHWNAARKLKESDLHNPC
jgi:hypothetical protein